MEASDVKVLTPWIKRKGEKSGIFVFINLSEDRLNGIDAIKLSKSIDNGCHIPVISSRRRILGYAVLMIKNDTEYVFFVGPSEFPQAGVSADTFGPFHAERYKGRYAIKAENSPSEPPRAVQTQYIRPPASIYWS